MTEDLLLFVVQHDAEYVVVDHALDLLCGAAKELLDVQDRAHLAADFVEQQQSIGLGVRAFVQSGVFDGHGKPAPEQGQYALLLGGEVVEVVALDVEHTDALPLNHQGHCQLRTDAVDGIDVTRIARNVADPHRMPRRRGGTGDSLADWNAKIVRKVSRIADGKAMLESTFVDQEHPEDFVVNMFLDQRGGARQHLIEVQRSVHLFANFGKGSENFGGDFAMGNEFYGY